MTAVAYAVAGGVMQPPDELAGPMAGYPINDEMERALGVAAAWHRRS